ncbi:restriction endonuclease subunit S [Ectothiorhodospiraceae bacterium 2226]|nr:restriction endonuclease subunit S [Ectothiorhodospiraceae bacterium 2226]
MGDWREVTITEIAAPVRNALVGGPFGSNLVSADYVAEGVPVIRGQNMGGRWVSGDFAYVSDGKADSLNGNLARPGDIVFTQRGTLGQVSLVPEAQFDRYLVSQSQMKLTVNRGIADPIFCYYQFCSEDQQDYIRKNAIQTGVPHTNLGILRGTPFLLPPLPEQRAIAHILGTLDDKIELNRRRNQTLEAMARALFKDWFVDFGPVRAKMEGRAPYLTAEIWELFPDRLDVEGKPEGWETKRVSDYLSLAYGKSLPAGKRHQGGVPVYGSGGITGFHNESLVNGPAVIVGRKGTVGSLYWEDRPCFPIDTVFYVQPKAPLSFCYYLLERLPLRDMNTDAAVPGLNRENVYRLEVSASPTALIAAFAATAARFRETIAAVSGESETLAQLRDTLLPKLISGELRVKDAGRLLERVA